MALEVSRYESVAQSFLDEHPIGSVVTSGNLLSWVENHPDGAAIKNDLDIGDPDKRLGQLRRHLNSGGRSDGVREERRFQLEVTDAKRKTLTVRSHADVAKRQATGAIGKSIIGALSPLKSSAKAVNAVKLDELPEIEREVLQMAHDNVVAMERAIKPTLAQEVDRIWVARMAQLGVAEDQAHKIREALPDITRLQKLLRATS